MTLQSDPARAARIARLPDLLRERILVLDGAMGTMIQTYRLDEDGYRGKGGDHRAHLRFTSRGPSCNTGISPYNDFPANGDL